MNRSISTWRDARDALAARLAEAGLENAEAEARWIVEAVSGHDAAEWYEIADSAPSTRATVALRAMCDRRIAGEPLQYVLGAWAFRGLDLMVDRRVLVPRPETEVVAEVAIDELVRLGHRRGRGSPLDAPPSGVAVDLGTGSGAIALALAAELPDVEVWATDVSSDALEVARANVAGCAATRVRIAQGDWFEALPRELRGHLALVVANPPYIADSERASLPRDVVEHEPARALFAGPTGTEALDHLVDEAISWLEPGAALVCEIAPHHAAAMCTRARAVGYGFVEVRPDLTGRPRVLVARRT